MYKKTMLLATFMLCITFSNCAGTDGSMGKKKTFKKILGLCNHEEFIAAITSVVFLKNHYLDSGNTKELGTRIEVTTEWRPRFPFPDEKALGINVVETKLILFAKIRPGLAGSLRGEQTYNASFEAQNRVRYYEGTPWQNGPMTTDTKAYLNDIVDDMIQELKTPF